MLKVIIIIVFQFCFCSFELKSSVVFVYASFSRSSILVSNTWTLSFTVLLLEFSIFCYLASHFSAKTINAKF